MRGARPSAQGREGFSLWWRYGILIVFIVGFGVLIWVSATAYKVSPPIPERVVDPSGALLFTGDDILLPSRKVLDTWF